MTQAPSTVLQALSEILAAQSPQFAARLKQRLTAALEAKGEHPFDERKFGFKGFRDFLLHGTQSIFSVTPSEDGADVVVSLLGANSASTMSSLPGTASHTIRSEIWQAFTNPDASRARFFNRRTFVVRHFLQGEDSVHAKEVSNSPTEFVEIKPISADVQVAWMKQFIRDRQIPPPLCDALEGIVAKPYSSGVNAAFTGALGSLGAEWRHERLRKIIEAIHAWANANDVSTEKLTARSASDSEAIAASPPRNTGKASPTDHAVDGIHNPREQAVRLLDMLSNEDISRVVVPILLSTLLVRGRS